ncbi:MAG: carboxymuconolactone decarboxylase family protein [Bryobacteraceae bacterium]|nr:carboxymuconolactone decarboxylase family protein [Bryobacteraceae bacterium]
MLSTSLNAQQAVKERADRGLKVLEAGSGKAEKPLHFAQLERDFPDLAQFTLEYSLGDVWSRGVFDPITRQLVACSAFAAQGTLEQFKIHAGYALQLGATPEQLLEVLHLMTVTSGFPRALNAAQTLKEVLQERGIALPLKRADVPKDSKAVETK